MSILINAQTRVIVCGMTGKEGLYWTERMLALGTKVVAGVTPGRGGESALGLPVFDSITEALRQRPAEACLLFVPPRTVEYSVMEALAEGIKLVVTITEHIPIHAAVRIREAAMAAGAHVIGGNTSGVIVPGAAMLGCFPYWLERVYHPGKIGVMTRSGSLTNEVTAMIVEAGFGVSTLIGVGGDSVPATRFTELLSAYQEDEGTEALALIGELGGTMEEEVASAVRAGLFTKPMVAFLGGRTAPEGKRMGHAGAIVSGGQGSVAHKIAALQAVDVEIAKTPRQVGQLLSQTMLQTRRQTD